MEIFTKNEDDYFTESVPGSLRVKNYSQCIIHK